MHYAILFTFGRITSKHNVAVTKKIQDAITASGDSGFSPDIVQSNSYYISVMFALR